MILMSLTSLNHNHLSLIIQLVQFDGCGTDEYHILCIDHGQYLSVDDNNNTIHFQGNQTKSVRVRLKRFSRPCLDPWRQHLDEGSLIWYRDDDNSRWRDGIAGEVVYTRKRKGFEKECLVGIWRNGYQMSYEYVPIGSTHICDAECRDPDHGHYPYWDVCRTLVIMESNMTGN